MSLGRVGKLASYIPLLRRPSRRQDIGRLQHELATLHNEIARLQRISAELEASQTKQISDRAAGRIAEFDYPYLPRQLNWDALPNGNPFRRLLSARHDEYQEILTNYLVFIPKFSEIPVTHSPAGTLPFWDNGWFPMFDAISIYGMLATRNPRYYFEVGSGNSTKFARKAIADNGLRTKIISVDPFPRANIDDLCDEVIRCGLEDVDLKRFADLGEEDVLFIDNSHRSFQGSDVTVFFTQVLPTIGKGCLYGLHDIPLPFDYDPSWYDRYYNEQYLLMTYLLGGAGGDKIILPVCYVWTTAELAGILDPITCEPARAGSPTGGSSFWMQRG